MRLVHVSLVSNGKVRKFEPPTRHNFYPESGYGRPNFYPENRSGFC